MKGDDLGVYGGEVKRVFSLFGKARKPGDVINSDELTKISGRHRRALQEVGLIKYYEQEVIQNGKTDGGKDKRSSGRGRRRFPG